MFSIQFFRISSASASILLFWLSGAGLGTLRPSRSKIGWLACLLVIGIAQLRCGFLLKGRNISGIYFAYDPSCCPNTERGSCREREKQPLDCLGNLALHPCHGLLCQCFFCGFSFCLHFLTGRCVRRIFEDDHREHAVIGQDVENVAGEVSFFAQS